MVVKDKLELIDTSLSIAQRVVIIFGILIGALLFFLRLEHTPSINTSVSAVGIDACVLKIEMKVKNIGKSPFTLTKTVAAVGVDFLEQTASLPQQVVAQEEIGMFFDFPISSNMEGRILGVKFSLKLAEDNPETWRILDELLTVPRLSDSC
ncbi:MAG: hypothetical protein ABJL99_23100 [Aliishimia sp.]